MYRPPWWFRGGHVQTLWGPLLRRARRRALIRERWDTPDGDFVDLDFATVHGSPAAAPGEDAPVALVVHGLEGSSTSARARGRRRW